MNRVIKAMGLVFGDIGTSPIYTLSVIFLLVPVCFTNVIGILSLIIWTLLLVVTAQYTWLAMSLSKNGEGGSIVLFEILKKLLKKSRSFVFFSFLTYIAISLLIGDSVITPAISILSAVEGLSFIDIFKEISTSSIVFITILITFILFSVQKKGTEKISQVFGPIMLLWFLFLFVFGIFSIYNNPSVLKALNPLYGIYFISSNGVAGFFILSEVILCATGAEALYADMGHLGRKPIIIAWYFVLISLIINYLGQGAFLLKAHHATNILFSMVANEQKAFYIPFLSVSILATIIASQAMISGLFSVIYQGINSRIFPLFKVDYTSEKINSQIYIGSANWFLAFFVVLIILVFQKSSSLANAYGLAVTGTIAITGILMSSIFFLRKKYFHFIFAIFLLLIDCSFFIATCSKIPSGAYWSILIALIPFSIVLLYVNGNAKLYGSMLLMDKNVFIEKFQKIYPNVCKIKGTALFFSRGIDKIPPYVVQTLFTNNIFYSENIFIQIKKTGDAFGIFYEMNDIVEGIKVLKVNVGYMQYFKIEDVLKQFGIKEKVIFYGVEEIETNNIFWILFSYIKKLTPTFVSFYKLPSHKVHGVITKIKLK